MYLFSFFFFPLESFVWIQLINSPGKVFTWGLTVGNQYSFCSPHREAKSWVNWRKGIAVTSQDGPGAVDTSTVTLMVYGRQVTFPSLPHLTVHIDIPCQKRAERAIAELPITNQLLAWSSFRLAVSFIWAEFLQCPCNNLFWKILMKCPTA